MSLGPRNVVSDDNKNCILKSSSEKLQCVGEVGGSHQVSSVAILHVRLEVCAPIVNSNKCWGVKWQSLESLRELRLGCCLEFTSEGEHLLQFVNEWGIGWDQVGVSL